jgi:APA family basic amino acid/polyamine antiporter
VSGLAVAGLFVLRRREPALPRPYRAFGYPAAPALFVVLSGWMVARALVERPAATWAGLATLAAGLALHRVLGRRMGDRPRVSSG